MTCVTKADILQWLAIALIAYGVFVGCVAGLAYLWFRKPWRKPRDLPTYKGKL